jgi:hypothetical protein
LEEQELATSALAFGGGTGPTTIEQLKQNLGMEQIGQKLMI